MTTGLDEFDRTVQESNLWLKDLMARLNAEDRHHAYSVLRASLHALRDRIGPQHAAQLGAQLPMLLRGLFYEGWHMSGTPTKERREYDLIRRVREALPDQDEAEVRRGICATLDLLSGRIDRGEAIKLVHLFPQELRELWPRIIREAAQEREAHAR
jgi:uncharacterized protein (DUF2267 family)